jgi:hypothetical protein
MAITKPKLAFLYYYYFAYSMSILPKKKLGELFLPQTAMESLHKGSPLHEQSE